MDHKEISGLMFAYYMLCPRKLWFYCHGIQMEQESEDVAIGKLLDENTFEREKKNIVLDGSICIDYLKNGVVYEIKKSKAEKEMAIWQIKYYLYCLYKKGVKEPIGLLKIPKIKYQEEIYLEDNDILFIEEKMRDIHKIIENSKIPEGKEIRACKKCAYYALCKI